MCQSFIVHLELIIHFGGFSLKKKNFVQQIDLFSGHFNFNITNAVKCTYFISDHLFSGRNFSFIILSLKINLS